ncbi:hypothetical protein [Butyrivibrio proteoclasticus]|uniref:hypothetical protein n=1 Tax=Butyrivibrio proteoclasticus TaxID=43305 RepID=UPI00047D97CD|nr:hypothetical protein [Butyrivibrio proteoclasticus]
MADNENNIQTASENSGAVNMSAPVSSGNEQNQNTSGSEVAELLKKQLFFQRLAAISTTGIFLVILVAALLIVPRAIRTINQVNQLATDATNSVAKIDEMTESITTASENLNGFIDENAETLTKATKSISEIDFEGLNQAISDLQETVGPMASFFSKFK